MSSRVLAVLRTAVQFLVTSAVAWLAGRGIAVPEALQSWFAETVLFAGALALVTAGLHWLESRRGDGWFPRAARWLAKVLMLGLSGREPVYVQPDQNLRVLGADGQLRPPR